MLCGGVITTLVGNDSALPDLPDPCGLAFLYENRRPDSTRVGVQMFVLLGNLFLEHVDEFPAVQGFDVG